MRANWSAPINYVSSKLSDSKKKFEILMKNIQSTRKRPRFIYCIPSPGDWQDDVRSSLYCHFWCSYIWTTSLVVWSPQMTRQTWVRFPGRSIFWNFKISIPMTFSHVQGAYIPQFGLKLSQPPWFGGCRRWINDLAVVGSIPCRQNCGTWSTPWGELKWVRPGQWSS